MMPPRGYISVEHDDGTIHAINLDDTDVPGPLWRVAPVCGRSTGVSSDEGGHYALRDQELTCIDCRSILG